MFEDFVEEYIEGDGANLFVRRSGPKNAEPIVLLHGYPQTSQSSFFMATLKHQQCGMLWRQFFQDLIKLFAQICEDMAPLTSQTLTQITILIQSEPWQRI